MTGFLIIVGLAGSVLAFYRGLDRSLNPELLTVTVRERTAARVPPPATICHIGLIGINTYIHYPNALNLPLPTLPPGPITAITYMKELARHLVQRLFEDHHQDLRTTLTHRVGCPEAAADVAQESYLHLLRRARIDAIQNPKALLFHVARQLAINERKRRAWHAARHENDEVLADRAAPDADPERMASSA